MAVIAAALSWVKPLGGVVVGPGLGHVPDARQALYVVPEGLAVSVHARVAECVC